MPFRPSAPSDVSSFPSSFLSGANPPGGAEENNGCQEGEKKNLLSSDQMEEAPSTRRSSDRETREQEIRKQKKKQTEMSSLSASGDRPSFSCPSSSPPDRRTVGGGDDSSREHSTSGVHTADCSHGQNVSPSVPSPAPDSSSLGGTPHNLHHGDSNSSNKTMTHGLAPSSVCDRISPSESSLSSSSRKEGREELSRPLVTQSPPVISSSSSSVPSSPNTSAYLYMTSPYIRQLSGLLYSSSSSSSPAPAQVTTTTPSPQANLSLTTEARYRETQGNFLPEGTSNHRHLPGRSTDGSPPKSSSSSSSSGVLPCSPPPLGTGLIEEIYPRGGRDSSSSSSSLSSSSFLRHLTGMASLGQQAAGGGPMSSHHFYRMNQTPPASSLADMRSALPSSSSSSATTGLNTSLVEGGEGSPFLFVPSSQPVFLQPGGGGGDRFEQALGRQGSPESPSSSHQHYINPPRITPAATPLHYQQQQIQAYYLRQYLAQQMLFATPFPYFYRQTSSSSAVGGSPVLLHQALPYHRYMFPSMNTGFHMTGGWASYPHGSSMISGDILRGMYTSSSLPSSPDLSPSPCDLTTTNSAIPNSQPVLTSPLPSSSFSSCAPSGQYGIPSLSATSTRVGGVSSSSVSSSSTNFALTGRDGGSAGGGGTVAALSATMPTIRTASHVSTCKGLAAAGDTGEAGEGGASLEASMSSAVQANYGGKAQGEEGREEDTLTSSSLGPSSLSSSLSAQAPSGSGYSSLSGTLRSTPGDFGCHENCVLCLHGGSR